MSKVCTRFVNTDELVLVNPPGVGFYLKHFDCIRIRSRQRTQLCYHVVDFCLFSTSFWGHSHNFYTYIDGDVRWFKRGQCIWT